MKDFFNKYVNKEQLKKIIDWCMANRRFFFAAFLFVLLLLVLRFGTGPDKRRESADTQTETVTEEATETESVVEFELDAEFEQDAYENINTLVQNYFQAYAAGDTEKLETLAFPISDTEKSYIGVFSEYIEAYENVACYTKHGLTDGSYLVSAYYDMKFYGVETTAPGLGFFYVETGEDGACYINNLYSPYNLSRTETSLDPNIYSVILKYEQQEDSVKLRQQVEKAYNDAVASDVDLATMISTTIPNAMASWIESVNALGQSTEEETEITETEEETQTQQEETENQNTEVPEENTADEPAEEETVAEEPVEEQPQVDPNAPVKVKVNYSSVNIRKTPSASGEFVAAAQKGDVFTKIGEEGEWTKIEFDGSDAYIKSDLLKIVTE